MEAPITKVGMPLDEFIQLYDHEGPFELIDGERRPLMPTVLGHGEIARLLFAALNNYCVPSKIGILYFEAPFVLPDEYTPNWVAGSRVPDIMFVAQSRILAYREATPDWRQKPLILVPDLVVEIISPSDIYEDVDEKVERYLEDGVKMILVVNPRTQKVVIHRLGSKQQTTLKTDDMLDGGDIIPGFTLVVSSLFE